MRVSHIVVLALLAFGTLAAAGKGHRQALEDPEHPEGQTVKLLTGRRYKPPYFVGRPYQSYEDVGLGQVETIQQIGEFYVEQGQDFHSITPEGRRFAGRFLQNLTYLGGFSVVVKSNQTARTFDLVKHLQEKVHATNFPILSDAEVVSIASDLEGCVANQGWLVYQLYPTSSEDFLIARAQEFDVAARRNYIYAACGKAGHVEVAFTTLTYAANRVPSLLKIYYDAEAFLREYILTSTALTMSGQCANPSFLGNWRRFLIHVDPIMRPPTPEIEDGDVPATEGGDSEDGNVENGGEDDVAEPEEEEPEIAVDTEGVAGAPQGESEVDIQTSGQSVDGEVDPTVDENAGETDGAVEP
jgi:hypothetical protein